jgi:hypothetical protein
LKKRIHATLTFAHPYPVSDPFGAADRRLLESLALPEPWAGEVTAALRLIGDITRFATPKQLVGYIGLCPTVDQSGGHDWRRELAKNGLKCLPPSFMEPDGAPSVIFARWDGPVTWRGRRPRCTAVPGGTRFATGRPAR